MRGPGILPWYAVVPVAAVLMVVIAAHLIVACERVRPASRRRIRLANGCVMLLAVPLLAIGFGVLDPRTRTSEWVVVWMGAISLLALSVLLAGLDALNTIRLVLRARRRLRRVLRDIEALAGLEGEGGHGR